MADKSITGLTAAGTITGAELIKVVQGSNSRKATLTDIIAALAPTGIDGADGRTVLNGSGIPSGGIGADGDFYLRTANYDLYGPKTGGSWGSPTSLIGPSGADGANGADGLDGTDGTSLLNGSGVPGAGLGNDGDMYLDYSAYNIYGPKTAGAWGSGTSLLGTIGSDGKTVLNGTVNPTTEGTDGDFYINTATHLIFGPKAGGTWPTGVSLIGSDGTDGVDGVDGVDGRTILYGTVVPTTEGEDGDFYIRTTTHFIYGPKAAGVWPGGTSLVGPAGNAFLSGSGAPSSGLGADGDLYIDTTNRDLYGPKASGTWPSAIPLGHLKDNIIIAVGDETSAITSGSAKVTFRMPYAFTLTAVRASLTTAQASGSILTVDINEGGVSILSTKLTIDNGEKTSTTAATPPVISDATLADDAEITIDIDQVGNGSATGLKVTLIGIQS